MCDKVTRMGVERKPKRNTIDWSMQIDRWRIKYLQCEGDEGSHTDIIGNRIYWNDKETSENHGVCVCVPVYLQYTYLCSVYVWVSWKLRTEFAIAIWPSILRLCVCVCVCMHLIVAYWAHSTVYTLWQFSQQSQSKKAYSSSNYNCFVLMLPCTDWMFIWLVIIYVFFLYMSIE